VSGAGRDAVACIAARLPRAMDAAIDARKTSSRKNCMHARGRASGKRKEPPERERERERERKREKPVRGAGGTRRGVSMAVAINNVRPKRRDA